MPRRCLPRFFSLSIPLGQRSARARLVSTARTPIMRTVRTIAVINQKGGVGKTTTVANLGAAIAARGRDVCLIDLDPQAHLTLHFGIDPGTPDKSTYDVLAAEAPFDSASMSVAPHLWVCPSVIDLAAAEVELVGRVGREQILRDSLAAQERPYKFILIDCPPSLGLLTLNALAAADEVFIPLQPHFLALQGLGKLLETVSLVQRRINPNLRVSGVIVCMYETTTRLSGEVLADLQQFLAAARNRNLPWSDARVFQAVIRRNVKLAECPSYGRTIFDYEPSSHGAADYGALAEEFLTTCRTPSSSDGEPTDAKAVTPGRGDEGQYASEPAEAPQNDVHKPDTPTETAEDAQDSPPPVEEPSAVKPAEAPQQSADMVEENTQASAEPEK